MAFNGMLTDSSPTLHLMDKEVGQGVGWSRAPSVKRPVETRPVVSVVYLKALRVGHYL